MVEGGMSCVKYLLFVFNLVFFLCGAALIGVGVYVQTQLKEYLDFFETGNVNATAILIIVVGALTLIIGFFGCCGAIKENHCMVMTFAVLIGLILICEIAGGIAAFVLRGKVEDLLKEGMKESMKNFEKKGDEVLTALWNKTQKDEKCCGVNSAKDWIEAGRPMPPATCCNLNRSSCDIAHAYTKGCLPSIKEKLMDNIVIVAGVAVGLGVVELMGIVFACCLGRAIRRESQYA